MVDTAQDLLTGRLQSRYSLVVLAAKRARQLKEGAPALTGSLSNNPLTIALKEIAEGKIRSVEQPETDDDESPSPTATSSAATRAQTALTESFVSAFSGAGLYEPELDAELEGDASEPVEEDPATDLVSSKPESENEDDILMSLDAFLIPGEDDQANNSIESTEEA